MAPTKITWDGTGQRLYETGVDRGVLYTSSTAATPYDKGVAWNGLTGITEAPSGAESNPQYADNIKYLNLLSAEDFGFTIEAFTYPDAFAICDGTAVFAKGATIAQQTRPKFGLSYRTLLGNDIKATDYAYKIHLIYGAQASPSERAYTTVNDSPEAMTFSWECSTTPVEVGNNFKPTAIVTVNSALTDPAKLTAFEEVLYGSATKDARLPLPAEILTLLGPVT